jgi:hypothetical protein
VIAGAPEGQRVDQGLAQDRLFGAREARAVEDAALRARQVEVSRHVRRDVVVDLPPVELHHLALGAQERHHQRTAQVLVPRGAQDAEPRQPGTQELPRLELTRRQPVPERAVREPQPKCRGEVGVLEATPAQVALRVVALEQARVVVIRDLAEQLGVARLLARERLELAAMQALHDRLRLPALCQIGPAAQQLHRVPEAHALGLHHEVDHAPARLARPEAVPQVAVGRDHQRGLVVVVEGAEAEEVGTGAAEVDAARAHELFERDVALEPLNVLVGDPSHRASPSKRPSSEKSA